MGMFNLSSGMNDEEPEGEELFFIIGMLLSLILFHLLYD